MKHQRQTVCRIASAIIFIGATLAGMSSARAADPAAAAPADDKTAWHGEFAAGLSMTRGNSQTVNFNSAAGLVKLLPKDEFRFGVAASYGLNDWNKSTETTSSEQIAGFGDYKRLLTDRFFVDLRADLLHDDVASVQNREIVGPAVGYFIIKSDATTFNVSAGGACEHQRQNHQDETFFVARFSERAEHSWDKKVKVWESVQYLPKVDDFVNTYLLISEAGVEVAMNTHLSLRVLAQDTYNSAPAAGKDHNDMALISSIVWKY